VLVALGLDLSSWCALACVQRIVVEEVSRRCCWGEGRVFWGKGGRKEGRKERQNEEER
jgi:hypothetical protein